MERAKGPCDVCRGRLIFGPLELARKVPKYQPPTLVKLSGLTLETELAYVTPPVLDFDSFIDRLPFLAKHMRRTAFVWVAEHTNQQRNATFFGLVL